MDMQAPQTYIFDSLYSEAERLKSLMSLAHNRREITAL